MGSKKAAKLSPKIPTDAEIDRADLDQLAEISIKAACDITLGIITPKEGNAISRRVGKRIKTLEQDLQSGRITL
jgi:hypothetical protein